MKKYLRFGEIPKNEKSINFLRMRIYQRENFSWDLEAFGSDVAYSKLPEKVFEEGVSVFELNEDGLPKLDNMSMVIALALRIGDSIYEVTGDEVGRGNDDEPLIRNIQIIKKRRIKNAKLRRYILEFLCSKFMEVIPEKVNYEEIDCEESDFDIHKFYIEYMINLKTGEKKECIAGLREEDGFIKIPQHKYFYYCGFEFHFPIDGFDISDRIKKS